MGTLNILSESSKEVQVEYRGYVFGGIIKNHRVEFKISYGPNASSFYRAFYEFIEFLGGSTRKVQGSVFSGRLEGYISLSNLKARRS